jgi:hypothetical protein
MMLSRAQEVRVREVLGNHPPGTIRTFCLEHLAVTAKVPTEHATDLAAFVRLLRSRGDCQTHDGGFCDAEAHHTDTLLVWKPPNQAAAQGLAG